ncbi:MAG TPA: hypothetical protein VN364_12705, partial [Bellilinea sp.]|nr:hypothetical protein [Bellilinea sp.]
MDIHQQIQSASEADAKAVLDFILTAYLTPAFGVLSKRESDMLIVDALEKIGYLDAIPSVYSLIQKLRVTRTKARLLLYERELRRMDEAVLDGRVKELLKRPIVQKQGELFALEIENPVVSDHLRAKVQSLGYASDGSFSPSLVKLSDDAVVALIDALLDDKQKKEVTRAFEKLGLPDKSFKGVLKGVLKVLAKKAADEAGSKLMENVLGPVIDGAFDSIAKALADNGVAEMVKE